MIVAQKFVRHVGIVVTASDLTHTLKAVVNLYCLFLRRSNDFLLSQKSAFSGVEF